MKIYRLPDFALVIATLACFSARPAGAQSAAIVAKVHSYLQTGVTSSTDDPSQGPFQFSAHVPSNATGTISFTPPTGPAQVLQFSSQDQQFEFQQNFTALSALNTAWANGTYMLNFNGKSVPVSLAGDSYPNVPLVTVSAGTWTNGILIIDPTLALSITVNFTANFTSGHAHIDMNVSGTNQDNFNASASSSSDFAESQLILTIPANTLKNGSQYSANMTFDNAQTLDQTSVPGFISVATYETQSTFTIQAGAVLSTPPVITTQPQNITVPSGSPASFTVQAASSGGPYTYQWYNNGNLLAGATQPIYTIPVTSPSSAGPYYAKVTNSSGTTASQTAILTVTAGPPPAAPLIIQNPQTQLMTTGSTTVFKVIASGSPVPTYQWAHNGVAISGATSATLIVTANIANAGNYTCTASNSLGSMASGTANLTLANTTNPGRLINLATRAQVGTGSNILIAGFVIGGSGTSGTKPVLIRGSGPALTAFLSGTLPDPQLSLFQAGAATAFTANTGWLGDPAIAAAAAAVGAFNWSTSPVGADSALNLSGQSSLASMGYTAQIAGSSGDTGVSLVEVYDATPSASYVAATPRLINLASRAVVGTGGNILIAGFVVGGSSSRTVLIRASGPALSGFLSGSIPDPQLQLYVTVNGANTLVSSNAAWGGKPEIANTAASVGAFAWTNPSSADSAILITLAPGSYSAQVSGASGDTGISLVEVYEVP